MHTNPWISVERELPPEEELVLVYTPPRGIHYDECVDFDWIFEGMWYNHNDFYEHYIIVGGPKLGPGPSEEAPYTHWMRIPELPTPKEVK